MGTGRAQHRGPGTFPLMLIHSPYHLVHIWPQKMTVIIPGIISKPSQGQKQKRSSLPVCPGPVWGQEANLKEEALEGGRSLSWPISDQGIPVPTVKIWSIAAMPCLTPSLFTGCSRLPRNTTGGRGSVPCISAHNLACCLVHKKL